MAIEKTRVFGNPDKEKLTTFHYERLHFSLRVQMRWFTRLTNGFSKSPEHHKAMQNLVFPWYNSCRDHQSLKTDDGQMRTPAMVSDMTDEPWTLERLLTELA